jgi:phospholipase C
LSHQLRWVRPVGIAAVCAGVALAALLSARGAPAATPPRADITRVNHIVVIFLENRSFDNLYGEFPGADGLNAGRAAPKQVDSTGNPYARLPQTNGSPIPTNLPNAPFSIARFVAPTMPTRDLVHRYYQEQLQIDGGKMDKFAQVSDALGLTMGYYHTALLPLSAEAQKYTLADRFFHSGFGSSFFNHIWLIAAAAPKFANAPANIVAKLDSTGRLVSDGSVTPDGYAVNTIYSVNQPHPADAAVDELLPQQTMPTIGDRLSAKRLSWAWYSGGWDDALAGHADPLFQYHHQPFAYFANYADGTAAKKEHLKDETAFLAAARAGTLPAVSFVKPLGMNNEHPGYADVLTGENHALQLINAVRNGPNWKDAVIIVTYDENGGQWDHVAPPTIDRWGPGTRIPAIFISPFAKKGFIDHTPYETSSILAFIEKRYGLAPLTARDAHATSLTGAFDFK